MQYFKEWQKEVKKSMQKEQQVLMGKRQQKERLQKT